MFIANPLDFYNNETCDALSVEDSNRNMLSLVANPAGDIISLESNSPIDTILFYNELWQLVKSLTVNNKTETFTLDISELNQGLYFVKMTDENANSTIKKLIKK